MPSVERDAVDAVPAPDSQSWRSLSDAVQRAIGLWEIQVRGERRWKIIKRLALASFMALLGLMYFTWYVAVLGVPIPSFSVHEQVAVVTVEGAIGRGHEANADTLAPLIDKACRAALTKAVVIRVRSPGGDPSESARIGSRVDACRESGKPVIAFIDGVGASGGYLVAIHADEVVADRYAYVGSIGALSTQWDGQALVEQLGLMEHVYVTGELKAPMSFARRPGGSADAYVQGLVDGVGEQFLRDVQSRRGSRLTRPVVELYTGEVWLGGEALELGLIDKVGDFDSELYARWPGLSVKHYRPRKTLLGGVQIGHDVGAGLARGVMSTLGPSMDGLPSRY